MAQRILRENSTGNRYIQDDSGKLTLIEDFDYYARQQAEETNPLEAAFVEGGRGFAAIGRGVENIINPEAAAENIAAANEDDRLLAALRETHPIATTAGSAIPYAGAALAPGIGWGALAAGTAADVALGAAAGYERADASEALQGGAWGLTNLVVPGARAGYGAVKSRMADRVASRIASEAAAIGDNITAPMRGASEMRRQAGDFFDSIDQSAELAPIEQRLIGKTYVDEADQMMGSARGAGAQAVEDIPMASLHQERIANAERLGYKLTPAELTGNETLMDIERRARRFPGAESGLEAMKKENEELVVKNLFSPFGVATKEFSPEALERAEASYIKKAAEAESVLPSMEIDSKFWNAVDKLKKTAENTVEGDTFLTNVLPKIERLKGKTLDPRDLVLNRRHFAQNAFDNAGTAKGDYWRVLTEEFDAQLARAAGEEGEDVIQQSRSMFRLLTAMQTKNVINAEGRVNWASLKGAMARSFPREIRYDRGNLAQLVNLGAQYGPKGPSSGTAENLTQLIGGMIGRPAADLYQAVGSRAAKAAKAKPKP